MFWIGEMSRVCKFDNNIFNPQSAIESLVLIRKDPVQTSCLDIICESKSNFFTASISAHHPSSHL